MLSDNLERYNFYKLENMLKDDLSKFIGYLNDLLVHKGIDDVIVAIKSTGISVNIFNQKEQKEKLEAIINSFYYKLEPENQLKVMRLLQESHYFNKLFNFQQELRKKFFEYNDIYENKFEVVCYLISLEMYLKNLQDNTEKLDEKIFVNKESLFESAIESTGMILKNFLYKKTDFKGSKRNIAPQLINVNEKHIFFSNFWIELSNILEYWKYSNVEITNKKNEKIHFDIIDDFFELNNHISNERFLNLRQGWQFDEISKLMSNFENEKKNLSKLIQDSNNSLDYLFATLYLGSPLLNEEINGLLLTDWIRAYQLIKEESIKFLKLQKNSSSINLEKICLSKTEYEWKKLLNKNNFTNKQAEEIIKLFTFDTKCLDLVDCPFVKVDDQLVVIPTLTANADASRALASNFLNRNINLGFKGKGFEDRTKAGLTMNGILSGSLYKRVDKTEYECDVVFLVENDLFFVECKAHVQPFTARQHANHIYKLHKETSQINRIADFFECNLHFVKEQLKLNEDFSPKNVYKILLTTSMVGTPMFVNGVYIIDESSFSMFIDRKPPSLTFVGEGKVEKYLSKKFDIYNGEITSQKMIDFLSSPPQVDIVKDLYKKTETETEFWSINRNIKVNQTVHVNVNLSDSEKSLVLKNFGEIDFELDN